MEKKFFFSRNAFLIRQGFLTSIQVKDLVSA